MGWGCAEAYTCTWRAGYVSVVIQLRSSQWLKVPYRPVASVPGGLQAVNSRPVMERTSLEEDLESRASSTVPS